MASPRDLVRTEQNQRLDQPELDAIQRNARSDVYASLFQLLMDATDASQMRVLGGFKVSEDSGGASALVEIAVGRALGAIEMDDGTTVEYGLVGGDEVAATQTLDFTGQPANTYGVYVAFEFLAADTNSRVFYQPPTDDEVVASIDTRRTWKTTFQYGTISPGASL